MAQDKESPLVALISAAGMVLAVAMTDPTIRMYIAAWWERIHAPREHRDPDAPPAHARSVVIERAREITQDPTWPEVGA